LEQNKEKSNNYDLLNLQNQIRDLKDENVRLQQLLIQRNTQLNAKQSNTALESQYKDLLGEVETLKNKFFSVQEENKELRKETSEKKNSSNKNDLSKNKH
jgi:hypothetical protein